MKRILLASVLLSSLPMAFAADQPDKIDTDFASLDNNNDQVVSMEEADDNNIAEYFAQIDTNQDGNLSEQEYVTYIKLNPSAVEEGEDLLEQ